MKKAIKLVWMMLFALPMVAFTACGDEDELVDGDTGATVELKDYSDLIGKKYDDVIKQLGSNYDVDATDQYQIVYYDQDANIDEIDVYFTFYEPEGNGYKRYEKAVMSEVDVYGFSNTYLLNRLQKLYGEGTAHEDEGDIWYTYEKSGKIIQYEYSDGVAEILYVDKSEYEKVYGKFEMKTKGGNGVTLKELKARAKANTRK